MTAGARPRIAIAHQTIWAGDAIGNDIAGMYRVLHRCGYRVSLICENAHPDVRKEFPTRALEEVLGSAPYFDLLIYHHSIHWPGGEALLAAFPGPVVAKYHNITPAEFFAPYTARYRGTCEEGRLQTARLVGLGKVSRWQSDSSYNAAEIMALGAPPEGCTVVPPFNHIDRYCRLARTADYSKGSFELLFIGRRVPNKGHPHILRMVAAWRELFPESPVTCRMVGSIDPELQAYYDELAVLELELGVGPSLQWLTQVDQERIDGLLACSHLYVNLSEHEGFCVPVIEAQAARLPVISTRAGAVAESIGWGQVLVDVPGEPIDYDMLAGLAHEICTSPSLRGQLVEAGCANVRDRFLSPLVANRFLEDLEPALRAIEP